MNVIMYVVSVYGCFPEFWSFKTQKTFQVLDLDYPKTLKYIGISCNGVFLDPIRLNIQFLLVAVQMILLYLWLCFAIALWIYSEFIKFLAIIPNTNLRVSLNMDGLISCFRFSISDVFSGNLVTIYGIWAGWSFSYLFISVVG